MITIPRPCDFSDYPTVLHSERYDGDWAAFYAEGYSRTLDLFEQCNSAMQVLYGDNSFQVLDVFAPKGATTAPVVVFFHGGGFSEGHPSHYGFLGENFLDRGIVFVSVGYRLRSARTSPDYFDDGALALRWVYNNIGRFGGDPRQLYLAGHSAGAMICASLAFRTNYTEARGVPQEDIRGCVLISGVFDFEITDPAYPDMKRPTTEAAVQEVSTVPEHVVISFGKPERHRTGQALDYFERQSRSMATALERNGCSSVIVELPDTNHLGTVRALGDKASALYSKTIATVL